MSAYTLSQNHIRAMLQAVKLARRPGGAAYCYNDQMHYLRGHLQEAGQKLLNENYRSVDSRYDDKELSAPIFTYSQADKRYTPAQIIRIIDCYNYQTCETSNYKETEGYAIAHTLREIAIDALISVHHKEAGDIWSV